MNKNVSKDFLKANAKERIVNKRFVLLFISLFFCGIVMYMLMTTIAEFTASFGASSTIGGLASGIYVLGALCSRLYSGQAMHKHGWKRMAIVGLGIHMVACLGYFIIANELILLLVRFIHGVGFGIGMNATMVIGYATFPRNRYGEAAGYFMLSPTVATGIGPYIGGYVYDTFGSTGCFIAATVCAVLSFVFMAAADISDVDPAASGKAETVKDGKKDTDNDTKDGISAADRHGIRRFIEPSAVPIASCVFLFTVGYSSVVSFYRSYAVECGLEKAFSFILLIYAVVLIFIRMFAGKVQDKYGDNILCYSGLAFQVIGLACIALHPSAATIFICAVGCAFGFGSTSACCNVIINRDLPVDLRALGVTTFFISNDLGMGVGPMLMGSAATLAGYSNMYMAAAFLTFASIVVYHMVWGRKKRLHNNMYT